MKKIKYKIFSCIFLSIALFVSFSIAEGSKNLVENAPIDSYRAYLEWQSGVTAGIPRKTILRFYAEVGETVKFGGSVYNSYDDQDITIYFPDSSFQVFDVLVTGEGYIDTVTKENIGPYPLAGGYEPLEFNVMQTGIYTVEFHGETYMSGAVANPDDVKITESFLANQASNVAAWDITVERNGIEMNGRLFTDYLALNLGKNITGEDFLSTHFYVLTKDGYLYRTALDNVDPFGFLAYSSNRGLVNGETNTTLYHSAKATDNDLSGFIGDVIVPQPQNGDTDMDVFHRIFFNIPSEDLPPEIIKNAIPPAVGTDFRFTGIRGNITKKGAGGTFSFNVDRVTTYQIQINTEFGTEIIGNTTVVGKNTIFWDGTDGEGNVVGEGEYTAVLKIKGGEYHFPFFDVENSNGITIELLNPPYTYPGFNPYMVYYNNSNYFIGDVFVDLSDPGITNPVDASVNGVDSEAFDSISFTDSYGDMKIIDLWTFFNSEEVTTDFTVIVENGGYLVGIIIIMIVVVVGSVFFICCLKKEF